MFRTHALLKSFRYCDVFKDKFGNIYFPSKIYNFTGLPIL